MRKLAASYILPGNGRSAIKNGILICDNNGKIIEVIDKKGQINEEAGLEFYSGILVPGFVHPNCQLELSSLNTLLKNTEIESFIRKIKELGKEEKLTIEKAIQIADRKMWAAGIAACGDTSYTGLTINTKLKSKIHYHTFVPYWGLNPSYSRQAYEYARLVHADFHKNNLNAEIILQSPDSLTEPFSLRSIQNTESENYNFHDIRNTIPGEARLTNLTWSIFIANQVSVLDKLTLIQEKFLQIKPEELFDIACLNGAKILGIENIFGSFEKGKKPGVNLISGINFQNFRLSERSKVKRLV